MIKDILKMIEKVDPADSAGLDEIDARVWCLLHDARFKKMLSTPEHYKHGYFSYYQGSVWGSKMIYPPIQYTRSRDALKSIRPKGWEWYMAQYNDGVRFGCAQDCIGTNQIESVSLPTEELAELHAILSAIEHERGLK